MKLTRKLLATIACALALALGIAGTAFAADNTISINNPTEGSTYSVYQVMTVDGSEPTGYAINDGFKGFFNGSSYGFDATKGITVDGVAVATDGRWENVNTTEAAKLASAIEAYALANKIAPVATLNKDSASTTQPLGYYVIAETATADDGGEVATKPILVALASGDAVSITLKDDITTLDKFIVENSQDKKSNTASIGDDIDYRIATKIPTYEANVNQNKLFFQLTDTFSTGLTYNGDLEVYANDKLVTSGYTASYENGILTISFDKEFIFANQGAAIKCTYSAKLNANAKVDSTDGNPNDVKLEYTNNTNEENGHGTLEDETITYTYGFNIHKVDEADGTTNLPGAEFTMKDSDGKAIHFIDNGDGTYTVTKQTEGTGVTDTLVTGESGIVTVKGLDEGTYALTETKAPDEYAILGNDVAVTITAEKDTDGKETGKAILSSGNCDVEDETGVKTGSVTSDGSTININVLVENAKGISLPETGSITTLLCMIVGGIVIIAGIAYYFAGRKRNRKNS